MSADPRATDVILERGSSAARGLSDDEARDRLVRDGANEVPEQPQHTLRRFLARFWGLSAWMLELIAALSLALHKSFDAGVALALLLLNAVLGTLQERRASAAVRALRQRLQVTARVLRSGAWRGLPARELVTGDLIRLRAGDLVPADAVVLDGEVGVDQSALTGESQEVSRAVNERLVSASVIRRGEATALVVATGAKTLFGRTTQLVETARAKLHVEEVAARLVKWMFVIVGACVLLALALAGVRGLPIVDVAPLALVLLMGAVPVAFPVVVTVSAALGSMELGRHGALVTRLSAIEDAATMDVLCIDKTGTLTKNELAVAGVAPRPGFTDDDVVQTAALASNAANQDPIDLGVLRAAEARGLPAGEPALEFIPFSPATRRTEALVEHGGRRVRAVKGALRTVASLAGIEPTALAPLEARAETEAQRGVRTLAVARGDPGGALALVGLLFLQDPPRPDARRLLDALRELGIHVKMLTGDALPVAREVARALGLANVVRAPELRSDARDAALADADGIAEVFPEDKLRVVKGQQASGHVVGMTGDGVNDAPALRQAEVGIAVASGTDVAKGAAAIVLTTEGLAAIVELVRIGRMIYQRVLTWIVNKVSRTILKTGYVVVAFLATGRFVISALGVVLLVFMTDFVKIALSTDRVRPSPAPETWRIERQVRVGVVLGALMLVEALALLAVAMRDGALAGGQLHTFSFLVLLYFAIGSLVSVRERRAFFRSRPSTVLAVALAADALVGSTFGVLGFGDLAPLPPTKLALAGAWAFACTLGPNDAVKVLLQRHARA